VRRIHYSNGLKRNTGDGIQESGERPTQTTNEHQPIYYVRQDKYDELVKSRVSRFSVIPAKANQRRSLAGIQTIQYVLDAGSSPA
jgi:hypothetical protein